MRISDWSSDVCSSDLLPAERVAAITAEAHRQKMMIWAHSAIFPARPAEVIAAGADVISHVCYLGYEAQPHMLAAYEDRTPVDETRLAPTGDDPVVAGQIGRAHV